MAAAMNSIFSTRLKLIEPPKLLVHGDTFIKWNLDENSKNYSTNPVELNVDPNGFILYWRDFNKV